jgi:hypothetical protein
MTRQPKIEPATAYDYRRYIELVQVLALTDTQYSGLQALCRAWGVKEQLQMPHEGNPLVMVRRLAQAAIEYHRNESERSE